MMVTVYFLFIIIIVSMIDNKMICDMTARSLWIVNHEAQKRVY